MTSHAFAHDGPHQADAAFELPAALLAAAEAALNRYIDLDPEGARGFEPIHGRIISLEVEGFNTHVTLIPGPDRVQIFGSYDATPDCLIHGAPLALARMMTAKRKEQQLASGAVRITGDTAVAQALSDALAGLAVDWEEQLARVLGDPIANQIGRALRSVGDWGARASRTARANLKEYLEEESRLLPSRYEVDDFLAQVDDLRDDVERLAARIARLVDLVPAVGAEHGGYR
jgi:ubiquinone biosynthesis accessory factor UbiJ